VDGVENEHKGDLIVVRVNIQDHAGRSLADEYDFRFTPTFIFLNGQGEEIWRTIGRLEAQQVRDSLP